MHHASPPTFLPNATIITCRFPSNKIGDDVRNSKIDTFLQTTKMSRLSFEETKSLIGPQHNIIIATTRRPVHQIYLQQKCRYHPLKKPNCRLARDTTLLLTTSGVYLIIYLYVLALILSLVIFSFFSQISNLIVLS